MPRLVKEFSTPLFFGVWDAESQHRPTILNVIRRDIEKWNRIPTQRGQEIAVPERTIDSHVVRVVPIQESRSGKVETNDQLVREPLLEPLFEWCLLCLSQMIERIAPNSAGRMAISIGNCWASVYQAGDYHGSHNHPNSAFAGVYCVESPALKAPDGALTFYDPRPNINYYNPSLPLFADTTRSVILSAGDLVIFPGWLQHSVTPFRELGERITISMNFNFDLPT